MSLARYKREGLIGRGRFCKVYKVTESLENPNSCIALKVSDLDDEISPHSAAVELRLLKELGCSTEYRGINWVLDDEKCNDSDGDVVLRVLMPYFPLDLCKILARHRRANFPSPETAGWRNQLPEDRAVSIIHDIALGLAFLHQNGVIHRDIKPENIMFLEPEGRAYIIDLDVAWRKNLSKNEPEEPVIHDVGTTVYRAPELLFGLRYTSALDLWPLGLIICQMFSNDSSKRLFEPYSSDIRLISDHIDVLGRPTAKTWPQAAVESETFRSMAFSTATETPQPKETVSRFASLAPRAPAHILEILPRLVCYEASHRITASQLQQELFHELSKRTN